MNVCQCTHDGCQCYAPTLGAVCRGCDLGLHFNQARPVVTNAELCESLLRAKARDSK
jgi:hypothetical protein